MSGPGPPPDFQDLAAARVEEEAVEVGKRQSFAPEEREECLAEALAHQRGQLGLKTTRPPL